MRFLFVVVLLLLLGGCAVNQGHRDMAPVVADSTAHSSHVWESLLALGIISLFALVLIPAAAKPWH